MQPFVEENMQLIENRFKNRQGESTFKSEINNNNTVFFMGVKNYTIVQSSFRQDALTFRKISFSFWKRKTKVFNVLQKAVVTSMVSIFALGFVSLVYFFIKEAL